MRGKLVIIGMFAAGLAMFAYSLWFVNNHSPVDERFNMRRKAVDIDIPGPSLLPEKAGDFPRKSLDIDTLDRSDVTRHGVATYTDYLGKEIQLEMQLIPGKPTLTAADLFVDFGRRAGGMDVAGTVIRLHGDAGIPYGYGVYSAPTYIYYEFSWLNGDWIFRAWTRDAGSESLLRFVNGYPY